MESCKNAYRKSGFVWMQPPKKMTALKYALTGKSTNKFLPQYPKGNSTNTNSTTTRKPTAPKGGPKKANLSEKEYNELGEVMGRDVHSTGDVTAEDFENDGVDMWESHRIAEHGDGER